MGSAARQLAAGNLSVRVGPTLGGRRDELSSLAHDFDLMAERIETLLTSQRNLLRDVSHELRSPLARMRVALELCRQRFGDQTANDLDRIEIEANKLNDLIGQILTYNKIEAQAAEIKTVNIDLASLIKDIVADANYETIKSRVVILCNEEISVEGNHDLLRRAIENIVRNALYYTPEDSVVEIKSQLQRSDGKYQAVITISDHGKGIPEEALPLIFKPFFKIADVPQHTDGTGLGLAISHTAIRLHNGSIKAENDPAGGLIMEIILPAKPPASSNYDLVFNCRSYF
jgi:two-component system sensor histidine kinase CpxA